GPIVAGANATDEELTAYLTQHPDEFRQPDRRRVQYVTLNPKDFPSQVTDADVEKFYKEHLREFETPRQVRASHVLVRVPETGGSEGENQEGGRKPVKEVAPQIKSRLSAEAGDRAAKAKAEELRVPLLAAKDFMAEARKLGLSPIETTMARVDRTSGLAAPDPLEEAAFGLAVGGVSAPVSTPVGVVLLKTTELVPAGVPPLAEIRDKVAASAKRQKAETVALERAKQIAADAQAGDFAAAAKKAGAVTGETTRFSRSKPAERLPGDAMLAALQTQAGQLSAPIKAQQGVYVVKVLERVPADMGGLAAERDKIQKEVLVQKQSLAWESWINGARANSKVETHLPASRRG